MINLVLYCLIKITHDIKTENWGPRHSSENMGKIRKHQKIIDDYLSVSYLCFSRSYSSWFERFILN